MAAVDEPHGGASDDSAWLSAARARKFDLLSHLAVNLSQPIVVAGPEGIGKTVFLKRLEAAIRPYATVCYFAATPGASYERIVEALSETAARGLGASQAADLGFADLLARYAGERRLLMLLLDDADALLPGLLSALWDCARANPSLHIVLALPSAAWSRKSATDAPALRDAQRLEIPCLTPTEFAAYLRWLAADKPEWSARCAALGADASHARAQGVPGALVRWLERPPPATGGGGRSGSVSTRLGLAGLAALLAGVAWLLWKPGVERRAPVPHSFSTPGADADPGTRLALREPVGAAAEAGHPAEGGENPVAGERPAASPAPPLPSAEAQAPPVPLEASPVSASPAAAEEVQGSSPTQDSEAAKPSEPADPSAPGEEAAEPVPPPVEARPVQPEPPAKTEEAKTGADSAGAGPQPAATAPEPSARLQAHAVDVGGVLGVDWLLAQNPEAYTLQVVALSRPDALATAARRFPPGSLLSALRSRKGRGNLYILFYGAFPSLAAAKEGADTLPASIGKPIPRQFKSIQAELPGAAAPPQPPVGARNP
jgi:DamX protein